MTDIVVIRGLGDREGDDVFDILLSTEPAALSRGRALLDARAAAQVERRLTIPYTPNVELGQTVLYSDSVLGEVFVSKIVNIEINFTNVSGLTGREGGPTAIMILTLIGPSDFYE